MKPRKRRFRGVFLINMTRDTVHDLTGSIKEALSVIESPAGKQEFSSIQLTQVLQGVPLTEPGFQSGDVELIILRCSLQQRQRIATFSRPADVQ